MLKLIKFILILSLPVSIFGQIKEDNSQESFKKIGNEIRKRELKKLKFKQNGNWAFTDTKQAAFYGIVNGIPSILNTLDNDQRNSTNSDLLSNNTISGIAVDGTDFRVYVWDANQSLLRNEHESLTGRITNNEPSSFSTTPAENYSFNTHATGVTGVIGANPPSGDNENAIGHAPNITIEHYDFVNDESEVMDEVQKAENRNYMLSNHSYGFFSGWLQSSNIDPDGDGVNNPGWYWFGYPELNPSKSALFGLYSQIDEEWDQIAFNAPQYTIVKAAGNDRNDYGPAAGTQHWHLAPDGDDEDEFADWQQSTDVREGDCGDTGAGFDCIPYGNLGKNVIIVAANNPLITTENRYTAPSDVIGSNFSSKGPTDDGRIKPDITATGNNVFVPIANSNTSYSSTARGTSFSAPSVVGVIALLQQIYFQLNSSYMNSDLIRALISHTANETGTADGPDYEFGWGLIDGLSAAQLLVDHTNEDAIIHLSSLNNEEFFEFNVQALGTEPLKATIAWIDPPFNVSDNFVFNDRTPTLVHDIDLRIVDSSNNETMPWVLDVENPSNPATKGDNIVDNIEQVVVNNPITNGLYKVQISHKGLLTNNNQNYALIISGISNSNLSVSTVTDNKFELEIYPNPVSDFLTIKLKEQNYPDYKIYDSKGALVKVGEVKSLQETLNLSTLSVGVYSIHFNFGKETIIKRFIKK